MDIATQDRVTMLVTEKRDAPVMRGRLSKQNNRLESNTPTAAPATCAGCGSTEALYITGAVFLCVGCIAGIVSMAASDIWPDAISYTREFERVLIYD